MIPKADASPRDLPDWAAGAVGLALVGSVVIGAFVPQLRFGVVALAAAVLIIATWAPVLLWPAAAVIPAAVNLAVATLPQPSTTDISWCADLLSPPALWRAGTALIVFAVVGLLMRRLGASGADIGLVRPSRKLLLWSIVVATVVAAGSLALGTILAKPFFGTIELKLSDPVALVPALLLAIANASAEEVSYRGTMLHWLSRSMGIRGALLAQAVAFGAAHTGTDFVSSPLPVMAAVSIGGLIAGLIVLRFRSLTFAIAVHAAFDIPLYYVAACRLTS